MGRPSYRARHSLRFNSWSSATPESPLATSARRSPRIPLNDYDSAPRGLRLRLSAVRSSFGEARRALRVGATPWETRRRAVGVDAAFTGRHVTIASPARARGSCAARDPPVLIPQRDLQLMTSYHAFFRTLPVQFASKSPPSSGEERRPGMRVRLPPEWSFVRRRHANAAHSTGITDELLDRAALCLDLPRAIAFPLGLA
jgi:hypothetical protein